MLLFWILDSLFLVWTFDSLFTPKISPPISYRHILFSKYSRGTSYLVSQHNVDSSLLTLTAVSPVAEHLTAQHSAIKMLHSRVKLVLQYVRAVQAGELPRSHEILREAYSLSHRLPVLQSSRFRADFYNVSLFSTCFQLILFGADQDGSGGSTSDMCSMVLGLNLVWDTSYHDWCFSYFSSVPPGKFWDNNMG
jgi:hypothetical protein